MIFCVKYYVVYSCKNTIKTSKSILTCTSHYQVARSSRNQRGHDSHRVSAIDGLTTDIFLQITLG